MSADHYHPTLVSALWARTTAEGSLALACMPSAVEFYVEKLGAFFTLLGKPLSPAEIGQVRNLLAANLEEGYRQGSGTTVEVRYAITTTPTLQKNLELRFGLRAPTLSQQFQTWTDKRPNVLFGQHPDARLLAVVDELECSVEPRWPLLDVGAGDGRNAIPLARAGWTVDAVELADHFCQRLRQAAASEQLPVSVIQGDICTSPIELTHGRYALTFASECVSHFRYGPGLRTFLVRMAAALRERGRLLFNIFLPRGDYQPDAHAREMSELSWATLFSREDLHEALVGLPLRLVDETPVYDYEKAHLPASAWPPTGWFEAWTRGYSIFPVEPPATPPVQMYWLLFERTMDA